MKKHKWIAGALVVAVVSLLAADSEAYLTDSDSVTNLFSVGSSVIAAVEEFEPPAVGEVTGKTPRAGNTGTTDCYVRAYAALSDSRAAEYLEYRTGEKSGISGYGWELSAADGYYYYMDILRPGEETAPLFTGIRLLRELPGELKDITIDIYFESVQVTGPGGAQKAFEKLQGAGQARTAEGDKRGDRQ